MRALREGSRAVTVISRRGRLWAPCAIAGLPSEACGKLSGLVCVFKLWRRGYWRGGDLIDPGTPANIIRADCGHLAGVRWASQTAYALLRRR